MEKSLTVPAACHGQRLDKVLAELVPTASLRARRRLCQEGLALVNGRSRPPGHSLRAGDEISVRARTTPCAALAGQDQPCLLDSPRADTGLYFLYKPAGLHTTALAGSAHPSLQALLPTLLGGPAILLNRLDCGTSGLVLAASDEAAAARWAAWENAGRCRKFYLALLTGHVAETRVVTEALDTAQRKITRILAESAPPLRHTRITPLAHVHSTDVQAPPTDQGPTPLTVALCEIRKGARHQIRAHAAHAGHPLWGDMRYATPTSATAASPLAQAGAQGDGHFFLHHGILHLPDFSISAPCPWLDVLPEKIANDITQCLYSNKILP